MSTIVNNPAAPSTDSGGNSLLIGVIILIAFVAVLLYFGIPAMNNMGRQTQINVPAPQVNIPNKIDVKVTPAK